jgi:hypothetical protein
VKSTPRRASSVRGQVGTVVFATSVVVGIVVLVTVVLPAEGEERISSGDSVLKQSVSEGAGPGVSCCMPDTSS